MIDRNRYAALAGQAPEPLHDYSACGIGTCGRCLHFAEGYAKGKARAFGKYASGISRARELTNRLRL